MTWCLNTRLSPDYLLEVRLGLAPVAHLHHVVALLDVREVSDCEGPVWTGDSPQQGLTVDVSNMKTFHVWI